MSQFRVLVADDEPLARGIVIDLLKQDPEVASVHECGDAAGAREGLARLRPDIAFLDIEMPGATGLQVAEDLEEDGPIVVFITAFSAYAPQAFEVSATDYVLKPFSDERFKEALDRAKRQVRQRRLGALASQVASLSNELQQVPPGATAPASPEYLQRLALKDGDRTMVLKVGDVIWIEAEDYYVLVHSTQGRHLVRATLASFEQRLDPRMFLRVHRTAIVSVKEIRSIHDAGRLVLTLSNGTEVAVSRSRRPHVEPLIRPRLR